VATKIAKQLAVAKAAHNHNTATLTVLHFFKSNKQLVISTNHQQQTA